MSTLEQRMVLHRFMCKQFGYNNMHGILALFAGLADGLADDGTTRFSRTLVDQAASHRLGLTKIHELTGYDENIVTHSRTLGITDDAGKSWKPFQYLALLFTERYLDLYFGDRDAMLEKLNQLKNIEYWRYEIDDYTLDDLRTLAFQSATGSGKTLLLHANILQYKHYLKQSGCLHKLNKVILVTPDEGLSRQHLRELRASNISAQLFSDDGEAGIFSHGGVVVDVIDLHKFAEKKGVKTVVPEFFEENNLVMVDEGHLGVGGNKWRKYRKRLARNGFTFEYSATFNQAVTGSGDDRKKLRDEYGKAILFDYSYRFFYGDGYGKDYKISNLQNSDDQEVNDLYLLACLLGFYQQCRLFADNSGQWREYNIAHPLWVFLGKTVTGGKAGRETETDVIKIIKFLAWVLSEPQQVVRGIRQLISDNTGLVDADGVDIFSGAFSFIGKAPQAIYDDLCVTIFHGKGEVSVSHLTGMDELQLKIGDHTPFGVINVGDASGLYAKLEAVQSRRFSFAKDAFARPLFADVDNDASPVNIVIGARKFAAGWNSWRVSTMGLMHVGVGEGPQIIQMFGRGVRLKGHGMSLKRHTAIEEPNPDNSEQLKLLETLNIFGLKANYMDKFKGYLQREGIDVERVVFELQTKKQFASVKDLKILKKHESAGEFQYSDERTNLPKKPGVKDGITLNRYKHLEVLQSAGDGAHRTTCEYDGKLDNKHVVWINAQTVYHKMLERKRRFSWHNMTITQETIDTLLGNPDWYELKIPAEKLEFSHYGRVREWEELAVDLISEYANQYWRRKRDEWEQQHIDVVALTEDHPNYVNEYKISVATKDKALIKEIKHLVEQANSGQYKKMTPVNGVQVSLLTPKIHAYVPLLHASDNSAGTVRITPVSLNDGEADFVNFLHNIVKAKNEVLHKKEVYLMRNLSRGKGISFFEDHSFYPDFILWVKDGKRQDIIFIDPKGLEIYDDKTRRKVELHKRIKETEKLIRKQYANLFLHSYIWSHTAPKNIGADKTMSYEECKTNGIFCASDQERGIIDLLQDALK